MWIRQREWVKRALNENLCVASENIFFASATTLLRGLRGRKKHFWILCQFYDAVERRERISLPLRDYHTETKSIELIFHWQQCGESEKYFSKFYCYRNKIKSQNCVGRNIVESWGGEFPLMIHIYIITYSAANLLKCFDF